MRDKGPGDRGTGSVRRFVVRRARLVLVAAMLAVVGLGVAAPDAQRRLRGGDPHHARQHHRPGPRTPPIPVPRAGAQSAAAGGRRAVCRQRCTGLLLWWLDNDIPYSAEELYAIFRRLTVQGARRFLTSA